MKARASFVLLCAALCALTGLPQAAAVDPLINELVANHTGTDTTEFVEVFGDPSTDYSAFTILEIEGDGSGAGVIDGVFPVGVTNGAGFWYSGFLNNEIENGTITLLLVEGFTGSAGDDLDTDDDGVLDSAPWTRIVDDIAVNDGGTDDRTYAVVELTVGFDGAPFTPGGASRIPNGTDTDTVGDWVRNDFDGEGLPGFTGTPDAGEAYNTPEAVNVAVVAVADPLINELVANHTGTDTNEFVEVYGDPSTDYSAFTILEIEGDGSGAGVIDGVFPVGVTDGGGFWYSGFLNNEIENGTITLLLVEGFTGSAGDDLDTNNDGVLDSAPWTRIVDDVAVNDGGTDDRTYAVVELTVGYDGAPFAPGGASRIPNGTDTDTVADWVRNDFDGEGLPGFTGTPDAGEAYNTPETTNIEVVPPTLLVINEIDYDQPGTDTDEFIEIYNPGASAVALGDYALELVNGNGGVVYATIALPSVALGAGEYFVVCGNAATVPNCDLDVSPDTNLIQNGAPDAVAIVETAGGSVVDTVSYEGDTAAPYTEGSGAGLADDPGVAYAGISRFPDGTDTDQNNLDLALHCITPGAANVEQADNCPSPIVVTLAIHEIQGSGASSPYDGWAVETFGNIVTAVRTNGFFMQTPDAAVDSDPLTSEGIFVFTSSLPSVAVGDLVDVAGVVQEYFELTEISGPATFSVASSGNPLPAQQLIDAAFPSGLPADVPELERLEGMRVTAAGIATGPSDRFGDVAVVARSERSYREPGIEYPGLPGLPVWDGNPEIFELDPDGLGLPDVAMFTGQPFAAEGVLGFAFGAYQVVPSALTVGPATNVLRPVSPRVEGEFTIASQNLLRLEATDPDLGLRLAKLSWHIRETLGAPDVLAVQEVDTLATLTLLADQIAADDPSLGYTPYLLEGNDLSGIDVGFLVLDTILVDSVTQFGLDLTFSFGGSDYLTFDRPPLVLVGAYMGAGEPFPLTVIANHLRSLGGVETDDFPRVKRLEQATRLAELIQDLQTADPSLRLVVTGDFNAFQFTDGYVDVMGQITGVVDPTNALLPGTDLVEPDLFNEVFALPEGERYSYVFEGNAQGFDYMLTSEGMGPYVVGSEFSRGNADAPDALFLDESTPMRVSDHDAPVLFILNDADLDGVPNERDVCPGTVIPESVPTVRLESNRWALVDDDAVFDTRRPPGKGGGLDRWYTTEDTAGCSCEQIIEELHLGAGQVKFGCTTGAMERWIQQVSP